MSVTLEFVNRLRRNLAEALHEYDDIHADLALPAFDRAALATVLENGAVTPVAQAKKTRKKRQPRQALGTGLPTSEQAKESLGGE